MGFGEGGAAVLAEGGEGEAEDAGGVGEAVEEVEAAGGEVGLAGFFEGKDDEDGEGADGYWDFGDAPDFVSAEEVGGEGEQAGEEEVADLVAVGGGSDEFEEGVVAADVRFVDDPDDEYAEGEGCENRREAEKASAWRTVHASVERRGGGLGARKKLPAGGRGAWERESD